MSKNVVILKSGSEVTQGHRRSLVLAFGGLWRAR